jgi:hypothetical protein
VEAPSPLRAERLLDDILRADANGDRDHLLARVSRCRTSVGTARIAPSAISLSAVSNVHRPGY